MNNGWVSISDERKPEPRQQVIVWHSMYGSEMARYVNGKFLDASGHDNHSTCDLSKIITAWRPLPTNVPKSMRKKTCRC